tara:strand:+ start:922 stop:1650 length:729 start_codon:yes stop_codon:yes gene_type:complete
MADKKDRRSHVQAREKSSPKERIPTNKYVRERHYGRGGDEHYASKGMTSDRVDERFAAPYPMKRWQNPYNQEWPEWRYKGESGEPPLRPIPLLRDEYYSGMQDPSGYKGLSKEEIMEMTMALPEGTEDSKGFIDRAADLKQHHVGLGIPFKISTALKAIGGYLSHGAGTWDETAYKDWVSAGGHGEGGGIPPTYDEYLTHVQDIEGPRGKDRPPIKIGSSGAEAEWRDDHPPGLRGEKKYQN